MPPVNVLIKPASSACNMRCRYCFYRDVAEHREEEFQGMLQTDTMERLILAAMDYAEGMCSFAFQGGEPTLAGLPFFREVVRLQKKHARPGLSVHNAIQTNGYLIDEEWAAFLAENKFLVGLSLDGPAEVHNKNRVDNRDKGTFNRVMNAMRLFDKHKVDYNLLCVVTGWNARHIRSIYSFFKKQNTRFLQFIPCLEPLEQARGEEAYHLSVQEYGDYLVALFDLWFADLGQGRYTSVRHIDNWLGILMGQPPEVCSMTGRCTVQFVVEGDGGAYPCDFYVQDKWRLGTVGQDSFAEMEQSAPARAFVAESEPVPERCRECRWFGICRNGCKRDRQFLPSGEPALNYYCEAYKSFFDRRMSQLQQAARMLARR